MLKGYIYKYTYSNGKVYIGQTRVSIEVRHYQHMSASRDPKRRTLCELAIAKYGEPQLDILETIECEDTAPTRLAELLNEAERKWIKEYDSTDKGKGYNIQCGGEHITPEEFILQEKWYEIFNKEQWGYVIPYVENILQTIGDKLILTNEKLNKEEKYYWYGYKFKNIDTGKEATFSFFYKERMGDTAFCDYGNVPNEILEKFESSGISDEERHDVEKQINRIFFDEIINYAIHECWIEDIRQTIWQQIMRKKNDVIRDYYKDMTIR